MTAGSYRYGTSVDEPTTWRPMMVMVKEFQRGDIWLTKLPDDRPGMFMVGVVLMTHPADEGRARMVSFVGQDRLVAVYADQLETIGRSTS